jgi:ATP-dependent Lon protease
VVTGLAYTGSGNGGIIFVETSKMAGKGKLLLTGKGVGNYLKNEYH